jgi:sugar (pentulose or hexulose) kinase
MRVLTEEGVEVDTLYAHGGLFRTVGAARLLAAAVGAPVAVGRAAGEGGAWGIALLAAYLSAAPSRELGSFLRDEVFGAAALVVDEPEPRDVEGFGAFLERYRAGLAIEQAAVDAI